MAEQHMLGAAAEDIKAGDLVCVEYDDAENALPQVFVKKAEGSCWMASLRNMFDRDEGNL